MAEPRIPIPHEAVAESPDLRIPTVAVRAKLPADEFWVRAMLTEHWGASLVASVSGLHDAATLDGFVAELDGQPTGLATYRIDDDACEVVTLDSLQSGHGIGTTLLQTVADLARAQGCHRVWLITTNDNLPALRFYQRRGWDLVRLHHNAVHKARRTVKPQIPERGLDGIPLAHALELELRL